MRLFAAAVALAALVLPGCLTTYYDSARWTDAGLHDALGAAEPDGWTLVQHDAPAPAVGARRGATEVTAFASGECGLRHEGKRLWDDARLEAAVQELYDALGRAPPTEMAFDHMHGD